MDDHQQNNMNTSQDGSKSEGRSGSWLLPGDRRRFTRRSSLRALFVTVVSFGYVAAALGLAIAPLPIWVNIPFSIWAGVVIGGFFVVGHDALHQSFTGSRSLNNWIGRFALLPAGYSASLWVLLHNRTHHRFTNLKGRDGYWEPWSPDDYAAASPVARMFYRLYRSPLGPPFYHLFELILEHAIPFRGQARREWRRHVFDTVFVLLGYPVFWGGVIWLGVILAPERAIWLTVVLGWGVPFFVWLWVYGFVIYLHHNHPRIAWFDRKEDWTFHRAQIAGTTETRLPLPLQVFSNNIMEHTAHHANQGIPLYHLAEAQKLLRRKLSPVVFVNAAREYFAIIKACKLFDYRRRQWLDFQGRATGPVIPLNGFDAAADPAHRTSA